MQFATPLFGYFFLIVVTVTWGLSRWREVQKGWLILASFVFYAQLGYDVAGLLLLSCVVNYAVGEALFATQSRQRIQKWWLISGLAANGLLLGFFKYYNFARENLDQVATWLGLQSHLPILEVLLPIGISFYTFQAIAYLVDIRRGVAHQPKHLGDFILFMVFFPKILIGPICRSVDFLPQLERDTPQGIPNLNEAFMLITVGLFKKVVVATFLATHIVNDVFVAPENFSSATLLVALYAYTIQIYCDFSGYTDMARGISLLLGFHLPQNFAAPYAATNIGEFWRRWHISFSRWLRDYIYFPLGGSKRSRARVYFNLMLTMAFGGIWHGAHWKFLVWGLIHGVALVGHKFRLDTLRARGMDPKAWERGPMLLIGWLYTFHVCVGARVFFRASDMTTAWEYLGRLVQWTNDGQGFELLVIPFILGGLAMNFWGEKVRMKLMAVHNDLPMLARPALYCTAVLLILFLKPSDVAPYIYFSF